MIVTQIDNNNYLVKIPFEEDIEQWSLGNNEDILSFFREVFSKLIAKYKIRGEVIVDFYLDYDYGIVIEVKSGKSKDEDIDAKIIFHLGCKFLIEVDYFDCIDRNIILYYYKNKFYTDLVRDCCFDGNIVYDNEEIINKGIMIHV